MRLFIPGLCFGGLLALSQGYAGTACILLAAGLLVFFLDSRREEIFLRHEIPLLLATNGKWWTATEITRALEKRTSFINRPKLAAVETALQQLSAKNMLIKQVFGKEHSFCVRADQLSRDYPEHRYKMQVFG